MNLQTISFITLMDSLFTNGRNPHILEENQLLEDFQAVDSLLREIYSDEYISTTWTMSDQIPDGSTDRKNLGQTLDISFHRLFKKLHDSFKRAREFYMEIGPEINLIYVNSMPSVMVLIKLYDIKSQMFKRDPRLMNTSVLRVD